MLKYLIVLSLLLSSGDAFAQPRNFEASPVELTPPDGVYIEEAPGVALSPDGERLYVFNRGARALLVFSRDGAFIDEIGEGLFETPHGLRVDDDGAIWTTDTATHLVLKFAPDGRVLMVLGKRGTGETGWHDRDYNQTFLNRPSDVAFDSDGNIYVADGGNFRIVKYSADGDVVKTFGEKGDGPGQFNFPHAVLIDEKGRLLVADRENKRIQIFSKQGAYLAEWADVGYPYVLAMGDDGAIWMSDARIDTLVKLSGDGKILDRFGGPGKRLGRYGFLHGVAPYGDGIYVSDILNWKVEYLSPKKSR